MNTTTDIATLKDYIYAAFDGDEELLHYFDKNEEVNSIEEAVESIYKKIKSLKVATCIAVDLNGEKVGYFVYAPNELISFGLAVEKRTKENLIVFFNQIKQTIATNFTCALWDHNTRAIDWLKKCGMNTLIENIIILQLCQ